MSSTRQTPAVEVAATTAETRRGLARWVKADGRIDIGPLAVLAGIALIWIFFQSQNGNFLSSRNMSNLVLQLAVTCILALGVVLVLIAGEIDLSLGSVTGMCGALLGVLLAEHAWPAWAAITVTLALGLAAGLVQGLVTVLIGVPSFLVTLGGYLTFFGVQLVLVGSAGQISISNPSVIAIANDYVAKALSWIAVAVIAVLLAALQVARRRAWRSAGFAPPPTWRSVAAAAVPVAGLVIMVGYLNQYLGVPYLLVILLGLVAGLSWVTQRSVYGRHLYAVGGNAEATRRAGVNVSAIRVSVLAASGLLAGLAGVVSASRLYAVDSNLGGGTLLLQAIAAAVIGGTSLFGGRGRIYNALLGAIVIESVENGLDLLGESAATKNIATGIILVLAVSIDAVNRRRQARTR
ncbi:MAG TPA: ABC transporter permease [Streptosporangiaceae bacterium]